MLHIVLSEHISDVVVDVSSDVIRSIEVTNDNESGVE